MKLLNELKLNLWREACRHIRIEESLPTMTRLLAAHMPLKQIVIRRLHESPPALETMATGLPGTTVIPGTYQELSDQTYQDLRAWFEAGRVLHCPAKPENTDKRSLLLGGDKSLEGDLLSTPCGLQSPHAAVVILLAPIQTSFSERHLQIAQALAEPLATALDNDARLRELDQLRQAAEAENQSLLSRLGRESNADTIVGTQTGLREVMKRVDLVSPSRAPVLILGESGSGKELIARAIHAHDTRRNSPFVRVNCGAIPPELIDSQLFGHEKGAFTGAVSQRQGWFERADGGTLFLDEIGDLTPAAQVRLLRVLQDGWLERVGAQQPVHVDVRIIAATNSDLAAMVTQGSFREDLWYRIAVFPILLPPLRERQGDIPALARHFAQRAARHFGLRVTEPTSADLDLLQSYSWPGNVREFAAVIDRAAILGNGERLDIATALGQDNLQLPQAIVPNQPSVTLATLCTLDEAMRHHIVTALQQTQGRIEGPQGAAQLLKINPHTLRARMRKLGIQWQHYRPQKN